MNPLDDGMQGIVQITIWCLPQKQQNIEVLNPTPLNASLSGNNKIRYEARFVDGHE